MANVLASSDPHEPVAHPRAKEFVVDIGLQWRCDTKVFVGDLLDHHGINFHAHHPDCPGPMDEFELAFQCIQEWYYLFPEAYVCIGNHDCRPTRLAESVDIPKKYLRNYAEVWETPGWNWVEEVTIDDVIYRHQGAGGKTPALNWAMAQMTSCVCGHSHSNAGVHWAAGPTKRIFGMDTGCLIDIDAMQFAYGKTFIKRPILGCGVVIDGIPYHEIMPCGPGEDYSKH